jgi:hypothetical protein
MSGRSRRFGTASLACVAAMLVISACDGSDAPRAGSAAPTVEAPAPSVSVSVTAGSTPALDPPLTVAPNDRVLIEPMSGTGSARTDQFEVDQEKYTIRVACIGDEPIDVSPGEEKMAVPCDGTTRRVHVATDAKREHVSVTASKSQRWSLAVVVTDDFQEVRPESTLIPA